MSYDASSIKILSEYELSRFPFERIRQLSEEFTSVPSDIIRKGFESCYDLAIDPELYVRKYLYKEPVSAFSDPELADLKSMENHYRDMLFRRK